MRRIHFVVVLLATLVTLAWATPARAVQSELTIFIDLDNNPSTGCNDPASGFLGYDQRVVTTVDTATGPNSATVTRIEGFNCSNVQIFVDTTPHPVGIGNGDLPGFNVVETFWPFASIPPPHLCSGGTLGSCLRLGVFAENANGGTDTLFTTDGSPTGPTILFELGGTVEIPTLGEWGLLILALLLAGVAAFKLRNRQLRAALTVVLVLCAGGVAYAIFNDLDGTTISGWTPGFRVAFDPNAQDDGDDIAALYARRDQPAARVYFRIDASLVFNAAPTVTPTAGTTAFVEDGGAVVVDGGITVTDPDSPNLASATVTITNPQDGAAEVLAAGACAGLTVTPGLNSLGITGAQPPAAYQACFQSVTYNNSSNTPNTTPRVVAFVANDGVVNSAPGNKTVTVTPNNDAPVVTTTAGDTSFTEDGGPVVIDAGVTVSDVDSANLASATVTITNPQDGAAEVLAATNCAGLTLTPGLNTLGISGSQSLATYQTCLQSVTFDDTSNNPSTTTRVISFVVNDGALSSAPANKNITVAPSPDAPVVTTTAGPTAFTEDGGAVVVDAGVTVTDPDDTNLASATVTITNVQDVGFEGLAATACGALVIGGSGTPTLTLTGSQPLATYQTCLQSVTYNNTDQDPGTTARVISFIANDGTNGSAPANKTVTVAPVNDTPVVTTTGGNTAFTEAGGPVVVDSGVTVSDVDNANLASATVTITNPQDGASEVLAATACAGLTVTPGLNSLGISGSQPKATYQTCLQSVTYDNSDQDPDTTARVISFVVNDGSASSAPANKTVTVGAVNNAPVVTTTGGSTAFTEDGPAVVVDGGVTVTDVDSANLASATVTITNVQDVGFEGLAATACGAIVVGGSGTPTLTLTGSQPKATYQTCLQSVTYNNTDQDPGTTARVISFVANDGALSSTPANKTVTVAAANDAPVVTTTGGTTAFTEDGPAVVVDAGVTVTDVDNANLASATVTITNVQDVGFEGLAATACGAIVVGGSGTPTLTLTGSQPKATYQTCLQSVTYNDTDQDPSNTTRVISFVANDGTTNSTPATKNVSVTPVNDAPVVTTTGGSTSFTEAAGAVVVDAGVTVTDADSANLASATVSITNVLDPGFESLAATACGGLTVGGSGTPTLTITGSQPPATYQTCLQSVTYNNTDLAPDQTSRVISFVANDGALPSNTANKTVTVTAVNSAPVVTTTAGTTAFVEDAGPVVVDGGVTVTDVDSTNLASATVTITNPQDGALETLAASACAGLTVTPGLNSLGISGSQPPATYQTCLQSVTYNNASDLPNTTTRVISFVANDGAASSTPATKNVSVTPANDAPIVTPTGGNTAFTEDGGPVVVDNGIVVVDADSPNLASASVTITNPQNGAAEVLAANSPATNCPGLTVTPALNSLGITGAAAPSTYQTCLRAVTYDNTSQNPTSLPNRIVRFVVNDGALNSNNGDKTVTVTPLNDAPVVTTTAGITSFTEDAGAVVVDSGVTVTDVDSANVASGTVTITNPQDGAAEVLSATACGGITVTPGLNNLALSGSFSLATYQTCLQSVRYNNSSNNPTTAPNRVVRFVVNDGAANSNNGDKAVSVTAAPDAPVVTTTAGTTAFTEDGPAVVVDSGVTVTDVDSTNLASATVTVTNVQDVGFEGLAATACGAIVIGGSGTPTLTLTGSQPLATYQTCLQSVTYNNTDQDPGTTTRVISFVANDGAVSSTPATKNVSVAAINDAPTVTTTGGITVFTEDAGAVVVDSGVTVADVDNANLASATVTITNPQDGAIETLAASACAGLTVTPGTNNLSITGSQPKATYQTCLQSVTYNNSSQNPTAAPNRIVSFVVSDGALSSPPATKSVQVIPVNDAPTCTVNPVTYATAGNTQLHVAGATLPGVASVSDASSLLTKGAPTDVDGPPGITVVPVSGNTGGGDWVINSDGSFTFVPNAGFTGTATRTFQVTDAGAPPAAGNCTVNVNVTDTVWYVRDVTDANNAAGGDGRSTNAFEALASAQAPSTVDDYIYVFEGNTVATPQVGGFTMKNGQKLWGQGIALSIPSYPGLVAAAGQARVRTTTASTDVVTAPATAASMQNAEIRGLDLQATGATSNAVDVTSSGANLVGITISSNNIRGATSEGIDLNNGSTGAFTATVSNNTITSAGNGIDARSSAAGTMTLTAAGDTITSSGGNGFDARTLAGGALLRVALDTAQVTAAANGIVVDGSAAGTTTITSFSDNNVNGNTGGTGIAVTSATFDVTPTGAYQTVNAGNTLVGASGNGVGAVGMSLSTVSGDLAFNDLDVFADGGAGVSITGSGVVNTGAGTGTRVTVTSGVSTIAAVSGPALALNNLTADFQLQSLTSTNSASSGVSLTNVGDGTTTAVISAPASASITNAGTTDFAISGGNATVTYNGTITDDIGQLVSVASATADTISFTGAITDGDDGDGSGVSLTGNTGATIRFSGGLVLSTGGNAAFTATGGGTLVVCDENPCGASGSNGALINKITTSTGTALNVANTTIGANNLEFRSISAGTPGTGPANGILLNNTLTTGGLKVKGTGAAGSGGTIQRTTATGISLTDTAHVSLEDMIVQNCGDDGIFGLRMTNFSIDNSSILTNGNSTLDEGIEIGNPSGTDIGVSGVVSITNSTFSANSHNNFKLRNGAGTISSFTVTNSSFNNMAALPNGANSFIFETTNTATVTTGTISGSTFANNGNGVAAGSDYRALQITAHGDTGTGNSSTISDFTVSGNTFTNNGLHAAFEVDTAANLQFKMINNLNMLGASPSHAIHVGVSSQTTGGVLQGRIQGNTIGNAATAGSGSTAGTGINVLVQGRTQAIMLIDGNTIRQTHQAHGINVESRGPTIAAQPLSQSDVTITNNDVVPNDITGFPAAAIYVVADSQGGSPVRLRADIRLNTVPTSPPVVDLYPSYLIFDEVAAAAEAQLVDTAPANATCDAQLDSTNTGSATAGATCALIAGPISTPP